MFDWKIIEEWNEVQLNQKEVDMKREGQVVDNVIGRKK